MIMLWFRDDSDRKVRLSMRGTPAAVRLLFRSISQPNDEHRASQGLAGVVSSCVSWAARGGIGKVVLATAGLALVTIIVIIGIQSASAALYLLLFSPVLSAGIVLATAASTLYVLVTRVLASAIIRAQLRARICPSCNYSLQGAAIVSPELPMKSESKTTCPECGSQWLTTRLLSSREPPAQTYVISTSQAATPGTRADESTALPPSNPLI
jgi:hypothetical protein